MSYITRFSYFRLDWGSYIIIHTPACRLTYSLGKIDKMFSHGNGPKGPVFSCELACIAYTDPSL